MPHEIKQYQVCDFPLTKWHEINPLPEWSHLLLLLLNRSVFLAKRNKALPPCWFCREGENSPKKTGDHHRIILAERTSSTSTWLDLLYANGWSRLSVGPPSQGGWYRSESPHNMTIIQGGTIIRTLEEVYSTGTKEGNSRGDWEFQCVGQPKHESTNIAVSRLVRQMNGAWLLKTTDKGTRLVILHSPDGSICNHIDFILLPN